MFKQTLIAASLVLIAAGSSQAQDWGTLKAKFVLEGTAPVPKKLDVNKDIEVCGKHKLVDESLVVGKGGEIANVLVYLSVKPGGAKPKIHPDYEKTATANVTLDNSDCRFTPHIVIVRTTQKLVVGNKDPVGHNTKADFFTNTSFNDLIPAKGSITKPLTKPEAAPAPVSCSIHPWMSAKLVVREDPYAAVSDEKGELKIENLPVGKWTFIVWQESCGYVTEGSVGGKTQKWARGKMDLEIKKGDNDLGEIKIPLAVLKKK